MREVRVIVDAELNFEVGEDSYILSEAVVYPEKTDNADVVMVLAVGLKERAMMAHPKLSGKELGQKICNLIMAICQDEEEEVDDGTE